MRHQIAGELQAFPTFSQTGPITHICIYYNYILVVGFNPSETPTSIYIIYMNMCVCAPPIKIPLKDHQLPARLTAE